MSKDIETKTVELLDKLDALATQYTPEVIEGATAAVTITAIGNLVYAVVGLMACYGLWWLATRAMDYCRKKKDKDGFMSGWEIGFAVAFVFGAIGCALLAATSIWALLDIWNWVAIFDPKLALAHRVLGL